MKEFWLCFVPLFVAVDAVGTLPLVIGITGNMPKDRVRLVIGQSVLTAAAVALLFFVLGKAIFRFLGVGVEDFMIAGGVLLFVLSIVDLMTAGTKTRHFDIQTVGAVPIGVPLITGPAVLTTGMLLLGQYGVGVTALAAFINILLAGGVYLFAVPITRFLGSAGTKTASKISSLLLAAIGVMMVRNGVGRFLAPFVEQLKQH
ncbi:MAG: hypothetical protein C0404_04325 [Verrucomicrobia bacterium]|nr:hypothetical protein [Verrucomicrobiota bacterium]